MQGLIESLMGGFEACIASFKKLPHVRRNQRVRKAGKRALALYITQVKRASRVQIHNADVGSDRTDAGLFGRNIEGDETNRNMSPMQ